MQKKKVPFSLYKAELSDIQEIESLLHPHYFDESGYSHLDYDSAATQNMIKEWITEGVAFIIRSEGKIVAFAAMGFMRTFYKQIEADVDMFFVLPEYRATGVSRALASVISDYAQDGGASVVYTSCLSGLGEKNNQQYINLWKKFGFEMLGTVMFRS